MGKESGFKTAERKNGHLYHWESTFFALLFV